MKIALAIRAVALALCATLAFAAEAKTELKELLTEEEFAAAGLDKLSPAELKRLEELWARHASASSVAEVETSPTPVGIATTPPATKPPLTSPAPEAVSPDDLMGKEQLPIDEKQLPKKIHSRLVGIFDGWSGETKFTLENGQVWQQRISDTVSYSESENPEVTIFRSLGGYRIRIEGYRQTCPVKRIQ